MTSVNWTNVTTFNDILVGANTTTNGFFWTAMLWFIFIIVMISLIGFGFEVALLGASFVALISGIMLLYLGLVNFGLSLGIFIGIILLTFFWIAYSNRE